MCLRLNKIFCVIVTQNNEGDGGIVRVVFTCSDLLLCLSFPTQMVADWA